MRIAYWLVALLALLATFSTSSLALAQKTACKAPALDFAALSEILVKDQQLSAMKPWTLQSVVLPECVEDPQLFELSLTYWSSPSSLKLTYQMVVPIVFDVAKSKTVTANPSLAKLRGNVEASYRGAEKDAIVTAVVKSAPSVACEVSADGRVQYLVPEWDKGVVVSWDGARVERAKLPIEVEVKHTQITAFKALQPEMLEDTVCDAPESYVLWQDLESLTWNFEFSLKGECAGKWRLEMGLDASLRAIKQ